ncbi:MAG: hypothetical protein IKD45_03075 [Clostridia bacterium]|nr:hypothetical protein [Clostridia bacterium]
MKKTVVAIMIIAVLILATAIAVATAASDFDPESIELKTSSKFNIMTENRLEVSRDFYILKSTVEYLESKADSYKIFAVSVSGEESEEITSSSGAAMTLPLAGEISIDNAVYNVYRLNFGVILPERYTECISYRAFLQFKLNGREYSISSSYSEDVNILNPYEEVYRIYCDRSDTKTDVYKYDAGDGTYSKSNKLYTMTKILSAYMYFDYDGSTVTNKLENAYYKPSVKHEYFDGVLTLSLPGTDIPEWFIEEIVINGTPTYFEIYEGKIRIVISDLWKKY